MTTAQPLLDVAESLGISRDQLVGVEQPASIRHQFQSIDTSSVTPELLQKALDEYGDAFSLEFRTGDLIELELRRDTPADQITSFLASPVRRYDVIVRLDKLRLLQKLEPSAESQPLLYIFTDALAGLLDQGLAAFEDKAWSDPTKPLDVYVADSVTTITGPWLRVVGPLQTSPPARPSEPNSDDVARVRAQKNRYISWDQPWVKQLTPLHLAVTGATNHPRLLDALRGHLAILSLLYLCDRTRTPSDGSTSSIAEFRGAAHVAAVPIQAQASVTASEDDIKGVLGVVGWVYAADTSTSTDWVGDRLPFVQTRFAQILEGRPDDAKFTGFVGSAPYLLQGLEWEWKAFIEGRISSYLQNRKDLETTIGDTVVAFRERTSDLVKSLSDAALAAVAVLVGTFIASTFKEPFNDDLFRLGMIVYAIYLLVFPGLLSTGAGILRFRSARDDFDARVESFRKMLGSETDQIVGRRVAQASRDYWIVVVVISLAYLIGAKAAFVAADRVPEMVRHDQATQQTPSATPTPTLHPRRK